MPGIGLGLSPAFGAVAVEPGPLPMLRVYAMGDSITKGVVGVTADWNNATMPAYGESYVSRAVYKCMGKAMLVVNASIGGQASTAMDSRFDTDLGAWVVPGGGVCLISAGANDVKDSVAQATTLAAIESMAEKAKGYGLKPVLVLPPPYDTGFTKIGPTTLNGGFETAGAGGADVLANWTETVSGSSTVVRDTTTKSVGTASLQLNRNGGTCQVSQSGILTIGKRYRVSCALAGSGTVLIGSTSGGTGNGDGYVTQAVPASFTTFIAEFVATSTGFRISQETDLATVNVDSVTNTVLCEELANRDTYAALLVQIEALANANGYGLFDLYSVFVDANGGWDDWDDLYANPIIDFVHLSRQGELKAANALKSFLQGYIKPTVVAALPTVADTLLPDSALSTSGAFDGDAAANGAPTGWSVGSTTSGSNGGTRSFVDGDVGKRHRVEKVGSGNFNILRQDILTKLSAYEGQDVIFMFKYWTTGMYESASAHYKLNLMVAFGTGGTPSGPFACVFQAPWDTDEDGEVAMCWFRVPSGNNAAQVQATITVTGSPVGTCTVDLELGEIIPLTAQT